jgi:hypothetical protein
MPSAEVEARLTEIASQSAVLTQGTTTSAPASAPSRAVHVIQGIFRAVAGASEFLDAAAAVEGEHPEIARLLRTYGAGRTQDAVDHFESHAHLV